MNAPAHPRPAMVTAIDLGQPDEARRVETWLSSRADATPFHRPAWCLAVAKGAGQRAHALAIEADHRLIAYLPLTEIHSPLFGRALVSSGFGVGGGIIADDPVSAGLLTDAAVAFAERLSCAGVELRGGVAPDRPAWIAKADSHAGFNRPLAPDDEAELLAIPRKQRAEVRKALGGALTVTIGRGGAERRVHHGLYAESVRNLGTPVFPRALFDAVLDAFGDDADILTVSDRGLPVASVLSLYHRGAVMPFWGGGTHAARRLRANDLMYFALMRHARERGCTRFDFGRSKTGSGAYEFKRNWGFAPTPLTYWHHAADGQPPRDVNPLSPKFRAQVALWKRLPLPVANLLGPLIARGLG